MKETKPFKVHQEEIPEKVTVHLGMTERSLLARMLTAWGFSVEDAGDTIEHIMKKGIHKRYQEMNSNLTE